MGTHPHEIALSPDGKLLYVTDNGILRMTNPGKGGNTISIIDIASRRKAGVIDLGEYRRPHGIDIDPRSGRMVVTIENPDGLLLVDPVARKVIRKYDVKGSDPYVALLDARGEWARDRAGFQTPKGAGPDPALPLPERPGGRGCRRTFQEAGSGE